MRKFHILISIACGCALLWGAEWTTDGFDPQRTGWQRDEHILSKDNVRNMKVLWKLQLDNKPREMHSLFAPLIADKVPTKSGPKQIAIEAGSGDNVYGTAIRTRSTASTSPPAKPKITTPRAADSGAAPARPSAPTAHSSRPPATACTIPRRSATARPSSP
jgi:hypothetical protein